VTTKAILRRAMQERVPARVLERTDKMGFETPTDVWLRGRHAAELRRRLLSPGPLHDWIEPGVLAVELESYLSGRRAIGLQVWRWLSLESWSRQWLSGDPRVIGRPAPISRHPGLHRSYVQVMEDLERESSVGAVPA
jgi:hypothetical protein